MAQLNPYLNFPGNTEEAFNFYRSVFGGEFTMVMRFRDTPESGNVPEHLRDKIMHISLPLGQGNILMATDAMEELGQKLTMGNNFYLSVSTQSKDEADRIYSELSKGGNIEMSMADVFWGSYFGMFADKYGIKWMVSYDYAKQEVGEKNLI